LVVVEGMNMMEEHCHPMNHRLGEKGMNTVEEHAHPMNHRLEEEGMNMADIHMAEVEGIDMVEAHPSNHRPKVEGVEGIDREDSDMVEVEVVEREHEGVVLVRHCVEVVFTSLSTAPLLEQPVKVCCLEGLRIIGFKLSGNTVDTRIYVVRVAEA
jgi:hypothetical protein